MLMSFSASVLCLAIFAAPLTAQIRLEAESGQIYEGEIVSNDGTHVELETATKSVKLPYANLTPQSQYRLHRERLGEAGKGQLELAEWCVDMTLYKETRRHYRMTLEADASMTEEVNESAAAARTQAANEMLGRAQGLRSSNKPKAARQLLATIVQTLPLEEAATEASRLLAEENEQRKASSLSYDTPTGEAPATRRNGERFSDAALETMEDIIEGYKKLLDHTQSGLEASKDGTSIKEYEKGLDEGDKALKAVDRVKKSKSDEADDADEMAEIVALADSKFEEALVDCRIFLADAYLLRSSFKQAEEVVKQGLAVYPKNERLRQANERVIAAVTDDDDGVWPGRRRNTKKPGKPNNPGKPGGRGR